MSVGYRSAPEAIPSLPLDPLAPSLALRVVGVRKSWPARRGWLGATKAAGADVFADVCFSLARGSILAVLGENGSGKTTLLKIIAGLVRPEAGDVTFEPRERGLPSVVAYAGGERAFYFRLTVRQNLDFFGALDGLGRRTRRQRIEAAAATVDLTSQLDRSFCDLSSGLRQRLSVARALLAEPDILLLDEPTRALDPRHSSEMRSFIRDGLARRHAKTIVVATNSIDEADEVGDAIAILREGRLSLLEAPRGEERRALIRARLGVTDGD
ncbi:MAG: ABC transporter ATP-binding protein [Vulcanimicrobiaceae bacterium]